MAMKKTRLFYFIPYYILVNLVEDRLRVRLAPYGIQPRQSTCLRRSAVLAGSQVKPWPEYSYISSQYEHIVQRLIAAS